MVLLHLHCWLWPLPKQQCIVGKVFFRVTSVSPMIDLCSPCGPPSKRRQRLLIKGQILRQNLSWVWNIFGKKRRNSPPPFPLWSQIYLKRKGIILQVPLPPFLLLVADNGRRWGWKTFREPGRLATCHCYLFFQNCTIFSPFQTIILLHKTRCMVI